MRLPLIRTDSCSNSLPVYWVRFYFPGFMPKRKKWEISTQLCYDTYIFPFVLKLDLIGGFGLQLCLSFSGICHRVKRSK
jgi:hypothetical protein